MNKKVLTKASILLSSTTYFINVTIFAVIMGVLSSVFKDASSSTIALMITLPAIFMIPAVFFSGKLCSMFSKRTILIAGFFIFTLSGIATTFYENINYILICRAITGLGIGICMPLPRALIAELYEGKERASMMGLTTAVGSIMSIIFALLSGYLSGISWKYPMYLFSFGFVIILLIFLFIPKVPAEKAVKQNDRDLANTKGMGKDVYLLFACAFFMYMIMTVIQIKMSILIISERLGSPSSIGIASSIMTVGSLIAGLSFGSIFGKLNRYTSALGLFVASIGYYLVATATNMNSLMAGCFLTGFGSMGLIIPYFITRISIVAPRSKTTMAIAILSTVMYLGQFVSGYFVQFIEMLFHDNGARVSVGVVGVCFAVSAIVATFYILTTEKKKTTEIVE